MKSLTVLTSILTVLFFGACAPKSGPSVANMPTKSNSTIEGGSDGGGGGTLKGSIDYAKLVETVKSSKQLLVAFSHLIETNVISNRQMRINDKGSRVFEKVFTANIGRLILDTEIVLLKNSDCLDYGGKIVDGSIVGVEKTQICLNAKTLLNKLDEYLYIEQIGGLILHEISHHAGLNEEEAQLIQWIFIKNVKSVPEWQVGSEVFTVLDNLHKLKNYIKSVQNIPEEKQIKGMCQVIWPRKSGREVMRRLIS